jgi:multiple antibiotic resistance protein
MLPDHARGLAGAHRRDLRRAAADRESLQHRSGVRGVVAALLRGASHQQARMAGIYMAAVLLVSLFAGALIMTFFGISLPALRIAGGMVVARVGFRMLDPEPEEELPEAHREEALETREIAFMPVAMPLLSGPGSIAVTISMATEVDRAPQYLAVAIGVVLVSLASWLVLRSATRVAAFLGNTGMNVVTRLMGFILVCIGVQFVLRGFMEAVTYPAVVDALTEAYTRLSGS